MQIKYNKIEGEIGEKLDRLFGVKDCLIEVNPGSVLLPPKYQELGDRIRNLEVRPDDVWLVSFPRTGSTWTQEMVWCIGNDLDYEKANVFIQLRNPLLEFTALVGNDPRDWKDEFGNSVEAVENMKSPRFIKSHLPWELLPKQLETVKPKIIYVTRNPKDVAISFYHYCKLLHGFHGSVEDFCELMLLGKTPMGPMLNNVLGFWNRRDEPNIMFLKYEDMKKDHRKTVLEMEKFLGKSFSAEQIDGLLEHLSFSNMRKNPATNLEQLLEKIYDGIPEKPSEDNKFIRKGQIGDWRNYMTEELSLKFDKWIEENLKDTGLSFDV